MNKTQKIQFRADKRIFLAIGVVLIAALLVTIVVLGYNYIKETNCDDQLQSDRETYNEYVETSKVAVSSFRDQICQDSDVYADRGEIYTKGTVRYYDSGGEEYEVADECSKDGTFVYEMRCSFDEAGDASPNIEELSCANGCEKGACVK